ncbi:hypothetical protein DS843_27240 [Roseomonas genomospecies 6]|uniref:Uncharacterized protein n=1 Tax=Roseomonas genomospecies 6 TaxID=214106 RepID=A0A9W7KNQ4_9PROT|nr:hypothetical protein DS843_27240 [Roseomonas genomospecies 6]
MLARQVLQARRVVQEAPFGLQDLDGFLLHHDLAVERAQLFLQLLDLVAGFEDDEAGGGDQATPEKRGFVFHAASLPGAG